jgi:uncharacterized protein (DUF1810 family)
MERAEYDLAPFLEAQERDLAAAMAELEAGRKTSHWMWYMFPQIRGLAQSERSHYYGLHSLAEATVYVSHPLLGPRLIQLTEIALGHKGRSARQIFGTPDDLKFQSSATLFSLAAPQVPQFRQVLDGFFSAKQCARTVAIVSTPC